MYHECCTCNEPISQILNLVQHSGLQYLSNNTCVAVAGSSSQLLFLLLQCVYSHIKRATHKEPHEKKYTKSHNKSHLKSCNVPPVSNCCHQYSDIVALSWPHHLGINCNTYILKIHMEVVRMDEQCILILCSYILIQQ